MIRLDTIHGAQSNVDDSQVIAIFFNEKKRVLTIICEVYAIAILLKERIKLG